MLSMLVNFVFDNALTVAATSVLLGLALLVIGAALWDRRASIKKYPEHRRELRIQRGITMGRKEKAARAEYVKRLMADGITDTLEEAFFKGNITEEERNACYRMIGKTHHIPDLMPHLSPAAVKALIKGRRSNGTGVSAGPVQPDPAWGDKPMKPKKTDDKTNVVDTKKRFGEKALRLKSA